MQPFGLFHVMHGKQAVITIFFIANTFTTLKLTKDYNSFSEDERIDHTELAEFYVQYVGISKGNVDDLVNYAMEQMTDVWQHFAVYLSHTRQFLNFLNVLWNVKPGHTRVASLQRSHSVKKVADRRGARCAVASNAVKTL